MAISGLEQRNIPLVIMYPLWSPWGPGLTEPSDDDLMEAMPHLFDDSPSKQNRRLRSRSWGNYSPHDLASRCSSRSQSSLNSDSNSDRSISEPSTPGIDGRTVCQPEKWSQGDVPILLATLPNRQKFHASSNDYENARKQAERAQFEEFGDSVSKDVVTSMMVRNLPFSLTQQQFKDALDATGFAGMYDFCYLPHKFSQRTNMGYGFVNFVNPTTAKDFQRIWNHDKGAIFNVPNTRKGLTVSEAVLQGHGANAKKALSKKMSRVRNNAFKPLLLKASMPEPLPI